MKGDGEAPPFPSPEDAFARYGNWDRGDRAGEPKTPKMLPHEYARGALKLGLQLEQELGVNPFKLGMVGAHRQPYRARDDAGGQHFRQGLPDVAIGRPLRRADRPRP